MKKTTRTPGRPRSGQSEPPVSQQILQTSIPLFLGKGYEAVSMEEIARECGITKASVYYYFPSKADLLTASVVQIMEHVQRSTQAMLQADKPLKERLLNITEAHLTAVEFDLHSFLRKMEDTLSGEQMALMRKAERELHETLEAAFAAAAQAGEIGAVQAGIAARAYTALLMMGHTRDTEGLPLFSSKKDAARLIIELLWHGLHGPVGQ